MTALLSSAIAIASLTVMTAPGRGFLIVVGTPGDSAGTMVSLIGQSGGMFVRSGARDWIAIAYSDDDGFPSALRRNGALLVLADRAREGCLDSL